MSAIHLAGLLFLSCQAAPVPRTVWVNDAPNQPQGIRAAFRGTFELRSRQQVEFRVLGASWFNAWIDGLFLMEGPARYPVSNPEYGSLQRTLGPGKHVLAVEVLHEGVATRLMEAQQPYLFAQAWAGKQELNVAWKCHFLDAYTPAVRRINPQLGWIEWCDTRKLPEWRARGFNDAPWAAPVEVSRGLGPMGPPTEAEVRLEELQTKPTASGRLVETFGYESDNPAARFFLRDLAPKSLPAQGVWRRYDLGHVGLWRPHMVIAAPAGSVVEFAYSEALWSGRVSPWIPLSGGDSCNLDHYVARGGAQTYMPLTPRGCRFVEVHVIAPPASVEFREGTFLQRVYYDHVTGAFKCGDALLDKIWRAGAETLRSCTEDALIDNPTRERGQWTGDLSVGMEAAAASMNDLRPMRRGLVQSAQSAREDGLVSGMSPAQHVFVSDYAALWPVSCLRYWELTGDKSLLTELFEAAERNIAAFEAARTSRGIPNSLAWAFIDWGYATSEGSCDVCLNLDYMWGLEAMGRWARAIDRPDRATHFEGLKTKQRAILEKYFAREFSDPKLGWGDIGYHRAVLGLRLGFFDAERRRECIAFIKKHMLDCFPNDPNAPRLTDPGVKESRLITPYFANFAMPALIENGEADFVLEQYRKCWGWLLEDGRTTLPEVFDTRWSHCHQWSGSPTWQLSRYFLGLQPRLDLGPNVYVVSLSPSSLSSAGGRFPLRGEGGYVDVRWKRTAGGIDFRIASTSPITLRFPSVLGGEPSRELSPVTTAHVSIQEKR